MSSTPVIVVQVVAKHSPQMPFIHDDHVIQAFPPDRPDHPFDIWVLPRRSVRSQDLLDPESCNSTVELTPELPVPITDQIVRDLVLEAGLGHLLASPGSRWRVGHVEVPDRAPGIVENQEHVDHSEGNRRHGEEVDRDNVFGVVGQEGAPGLGWGPVWLDHILGHRALADIDAKFEQLAVDAGRSP